MIELNKDINEKGLIQGFTYYSKYHKVKGKIKNKKDYRMKVRKYYIIYIILILSFSIGFLGLFKTYPLKDILLHSPFYLLLLCFFISIFDYDRKKIKRENLLLEKYLENQPYGKIEIWEFGIKLFHQDKQVRDICWGNINSIEIYDNLIIFDCKIGKYSFFINSEYEDEVKKELEKQNMLHLCLNKQTKGEVKEHV